MVWSSPESLCGILDLAWEAVHSYRINLAVDDILNFSDHAGEPGMREPALEDGELYALTVLFADFGDTFESFLPSPFRIAYIVRNENVHPVKAA